MTESASSKVANSSIVADDSLRWKSNLVKSLDLELAAFESGTGPALIFLSGGPGDDHVYLRPVAARLTPYFRCILFDQRGCGQSRLATYNEETLQLNNFLSDLEAIRRHLGEEKIGLVGHSWGANLALYYAIFYPYRVAALSLVGAGPISEEMARVASANLNQALSPAEKAELALIREQRDALTKTEEYNFEAYRELHVRSFEIGTRRSFYSPQIAAQFIEQFRANYNYNPKVSKYLLPSMRQVDVVSQLAQITARLQVIYGYQDFEPIVQAYLIKEKIPQTEICLINECGHVPWVEQPEVFYQALIRFFKDG